MESEEWYFNKENTKDLIKQEFKKRNKHYKSMVCIKYQLPFPLPFNDNEKFLFKYKDYDIALISKNFEVSRYVNKETVIPKYITEVEIAVLYYDYISKDMIDGKKDFTIDLTFEFLNHLITSLMVKFKPSRVHIISRQDLPPLIPIRFVRNSNFKESSIEVFGVINLHFNHLSSTRYLSNAEIKELINFSNNRSVNPFVESTIYLRESDENIKKGRYQRGVISLQTGIEMFMYTLIKQILINKNNDSQERINNLLKAGYKNILNIHLKKHFQEEGFIFEFNDIDNKENLLNNYKKDIYLLRNNIVHEGKYCTEEEAIIAIETCNEMMKRVIDSINSSELKKYAFKNENLLF